MLDDRHILPASLLAVLLLVLGACAAHTPRRPTGKATDDAIFIEPIPQSLYLAPITTPSGEWAQVLFHVNIHNRSRRPVTLRSVTLRETTAGQVGRVTRMKGALLASRLRALPWIVIRDRQTLAAAHRWHDAFVQPKGDTTIEPGDGVALLGVLIIARIEALPDAVTCLVHHSRGLASTRFAVRHYRQKTRLRLPFSGRWLVVASHGFAERHSQLHIASESHAYDFAISGADGLTYSGDPTRPSSFLAHGQPVLAAADGEVVALNDGVADQRRVGQRPFWGRTLRRPADLAGNFVVLRHVGDEHSAYLHLQPGLSVTLGQHVRAGQPIGRCGNSGNSGEPHLHFQLQNGPDPILAAGLPARFVDFSAYYGRHTLYATPDQPAALPTRLPLQPGRQPGATVLGDVFRRRYR